jgi:hypothetical protein
MSTYTRPRTKRQLRHPASRSNSHSLDKRQGEARKETAWFGVDAPERPSPQRNFHGLAGHEYIHENGRWRRCQGPEEFADYLESEAKKRSWFMGHTQRKGVAVDMKRRVPPLDTLTTSFAPWLSAWTAAEFAAGRNPRPKLGAIRSLWLQAAMKALSGARHLLGYAFHADTDDLHFDLCLSRQDGVGGRIGEAGLRLTGPWTCGCDRQLRSGATIRAEKANQLKRSVANFRHRYGQEAKPLDVTLARSLDAAADTVLGAELRPYVEAYAKQVPELERKHAAAQLEVIEGAKERLLRRTIPSPAHEPSPVPAPPPVVEPDFPSIG